MTSAATARALSCACALLSACDVEPPPSQASASASTTAPASSSSPAAICAHLRPIVEAAGSRVPTPGEDFQRTCEAVQEGHRAEGEPRWSCTTSCLLAASSMDDVKACSKRCDPNPPAVACDAILTPEALSAALKLAVKRGPADSTGSIGPTTTCTRSFLLGDEGQMLLMKLTRHATRWEASHGVESSSASLGTKVEGIGDIAFTITGQPAPADPQGGRPTAPTQGKCAVRFAKTRISAEVSSLTQACDSRRITAAAAIVAAGLP